MKNKKRKRSQTYREKYFRKDYSARWLRIQEYVNLGNIRSIFKYWVGAEAERVPIEPRNNQQDERKREIGDQEFSFSSPIPEPADPAFSYQPSLLCLLFLCSGIVLDRFAFSVGWQVWFFAVWAFLAFWLFWAILNRREYLAVAELDYSFLYGPARKPYPRHWSHTLFERVPARMASGSMILGITVLCFGGLWNHQGWSLYSPCDLSAFCTTEPKLGCVRGVVASRLLLIEAPTSFSPIPENDKTSFTLDIQAVRHRTNWVKARGTAQVSISGHLLGVHVGDRLEITGRIAQPAGPDAPGNFDFRNYLRSKRILSILFASYPDAVKRLPTSDDAPTRIWSRQLERIQETARKSLFKYIDFRQARLASAVLLGNRSELPTEMVERFQETGTIHILVVSGLHVSMISVLLNALLCPLPIKKSNRILFIAGFVLLYVAVTGWQAPAVRAGVLSAVAAAAYWRNQKILSFNVLAAAGIIVLINNPADLFNAGTQLSFLAVGTIVASAAFTQRVTKKILPEPWKPENRLRFSLMRKGWYKSFLRSLRGKSSTKDARWVPPVRLVLRGLVGMTLISVFILAVIGPLVATRFHVLSIFSIVLNLFLWIPIFVATATGMVTMSIGSFDHSTLFSTLASGTGQVCEIMLWTIEGIVQTVHAWRWGRIWTCGLSEWLLTVFYLLLLGWTLVPYLRKRPARMGALLSVWAMAAALIPLWGQLSRPAQVDIDFVNVGHGGCSIIQMPNGQTLLYDAGQMSNPRFGAQTVSCLLWSRGITKVHGVVISHADADHYNMLPDLSERFAIDTVYVSSRMFEEKGNFLLDKFKRFLEEAHVNVIPVKRGDKLGAFPGWKLEVLHPDSRGVLDPISMENANSIVLDLQFGPNRALFSGDISGNGQADLIMDDYPTPVDVLQAPHHGAADCNTQAFIDWARPRNVVIPESAMNLQKKICLRYEQSGAKTFHTGRDGTVHFVFKNRTEMDKR